MAAQRCLRLDAGQAHRWSDHRFSPHHGTDLRHQSGRGVPYWRSAAGTRLRSSRRDRTHLTLSTLVARWEDDWMDTSDIVTAVLAFFSIVVAVVALIRGESRASKIEKADNTRLAREEVELNRQMSARPTAEFLELEMKEPRRFKFRVTNIGKAAWWDLKPSLIDSNGDDISQPFEQDYLPVLNPGERCEFALSTNNAAGGSAVYLRFEWGDEKGNHAHTSKVEIPPV